MCLYLPGSSSNLLQIEPVLIRLFGCTSLCTAGNTIRFSRDETHYDGPIYKQCFIEKTNKQSKFLNNFENDHSV